MDSSRLIFPMAAQVALTFAVGVYLLTTRVLAVKRKQIDPRYFKTMTLGEPTPKMIQASRQFINLFEVPVLFFAACLAAMALQVQSACLVPLAWAFVALRTLQAWVHLGPNKILVRMSLFVAGFGVVMAMWAELLCRRLT